MKHIICATVLIAPLLWGSPLRAQAWRISDRPTGELSRAASLESKDGDIVALWMKSGDPGDELITYHDYTENGFRRTQYFYNGILSSSLVLRKQTYYSYKSGFKAEPYYGKDEILYLRPTKDGQYEVHSSQFSRIWFKVTCDDAGRAFVTAVPIPQ